MEMRTFPCTEEGAIAAQAFLESVCDSPKPAIVMDEIVSNIVRCSGASGFTIRLDWEQGGIRMTFVDDGVAFDPTKDSEEPDITSAAEDRRIGGLGIFLVKKMSKFVAYERQDGKNILTILL